MDWGHRVGRRISLRDLHIVLAVAECGSMAKASVRLAISHPVVSKTISDLEHVLGVRLFDRSSRGVELTTYGRALFKCGVIVFDDVRQGLGQIEFLKDADSGELRIGCPEITMASVLPAIVERFSRRYPQIRLHVIHAETALLQFQELRERKVELLIGRTSRPFLEEDLNAESLFDEVFVAVAAAGSRWARRQQIELAELIEERWVLPPYDSVPGSLIAMIFHARNLKPPLASLVTLSAQLTVNLISTGSFVGLLPNSIVQFNAKRAGLKRLPVKLSAQRVAADIITVKNRTLNPLAERFMECARDVAKPLSNRN